MTAHDPKQGAVLAGDNQGKVRGLRLTWDIIDCPPGASAVRCKTCRAHFRLTDEPLLDGFGARCRACGSITVGTGVGVGLRREDVPLALDPAAVHGRTWFHATQRQNWLETVRAGRCKYRWREDDPEGNVILVHLGSEQAARTRAASQDLRAARLPWSLHEVRLKPGTPVSDCLFHDMNGIAPGTVRDARKTGTFIEGANRYVNDFEHVGSISLLISPWMIEPVAETALTPSRKNAEDTIVSGVTNPCLSVA